MRHPNGRAFAIGRIVAALVLALAVATPASAQFGALKKKLKGDAVNKAVDKAVDGAAGGDSAKAPTETGTAASTAGGAGPNAKAAGGESPATPTSTGGTLVMTPETVDRLIKGLKAGKSERDKALTEDTPYGRYNRAKDAYEKGVAAYEAAQAKCGAAHQAFATRLAGDEKLMAKNQRYLEKSIDAGTKQDYKTQQIYSDSAMALIDPSCTVKRPDQPKQPDDYYDSERAANERAEQATLKAADFSSRQDLGYASDKAIAILTGQTSDASPSEKSAVQAKDAELKPLLGLRPAREERVGKQKKGAVADTAPPTPAPDAPAAPSGAVSVNDCMMKNVQAYQAEIEALGNRGDAARKAGNNALMMAISDTIRMIQYAGCNGAR